MRISHAGDGRGEWLHAPEGVCEDGTFASRAAGEFRTVLTAARRARAERFLAQNLRPLIYNPQIRPHWIGDTDRFWYRYEGPEGTTFKLVDAATGQAHDAFNHAAVAAAISVETGSPCGPGQLPVSDIDLAMLPAIRVKLTDGRWLRISSEGAIWEPPPPRLHEGEVASPDRRRVVFRRDHDLALRDLAMSVETGLTRDGSTHHAYGLSLIHISEPTRRS